MRGDESIVDPESAELGAHEAAERVVADTGDQRRAIAKPSRGHCDIGGTSAQELPERFHLFEADTDLKRVDVDPAPADGQYVERL
jgi:hypothetical protein